MRRNALIILIGLCALIMGLTVLEGTGYLQPLKKALQINSVPTAMLDSGKIGKILKDHNLVMMSPNDYTRYKPTTHNISLLKDNLEQSDYGERRARQGMDLGDRALMTFNLETNVNGKAEIYWSYYQDQFSETRKSTFDMKAGKTHYKAVIGDINEIQKIRVDLLQQPGQIVIRSIGIFQQGNDPIVISSAKDFQALTPNHFALIDDIQNNSAVFVSLGDDPHFVIDVEAYIAVHDEAIFQKKRTVGDTLYEANPRRSRGFESTNILMRKEGLDWAAQPLPVLSLAVAHDDLYDPEIGIVVNHEGRGRAWERPVEVTYFHSNGSVLFCAQAGIRLHGGIHGRKKKPNSYRLYFRKKYGRNQFLPGIVEGYYAPIKSLVVHATNWPPKMPYNNALAYDLARRMGCDAPALKLVKLFFNGEDKGIFYITPHLSKRQMRAELGHTNFEFYRFKSDNDRRSQAFLLNNFWKTANNQDALSIAFVKQKIDLDNFTRLILALSYCGTTDNCQGAAVMNYETEDPKLYFKIWDMDHSFIDIGPMYFNNGIVRPVWAQPSWTMFYRKQKQYCGNSVLFTRLVDKDPGYQVYTARLTLEVLNHRLTPDFLHERFEFYRALSEGMGREDGEYLEMLEEFLENRSAFMIQELKRMFALPDFVELEINGPQNAAFEVDGYVKADSYKGTYLSGDSVEIRLLKTQGIKNPKLKINGKLMSGSEVEIKLEHTTTVDIVS
jgi:hypothetical protein